LGSGIQYENEINLRSFFKKQNPNCIIIQHYGGGSGLLKSEILLALEDIK
jgi:Mg2+/Co2+ transporter CorC